MAKKNGFKDAFYDVLDMLHIVGDIARCVESIK